MTADLYRLLPGVIRRRDAEQGEPLRALLAVIAEQVDVVRDDIDQRYEDWFIETCRDWVVPYLGDLVGYEPAAGMTDNPRELTAVAPRADVADTVANRRRKGTLALLEHLAADAARWPARAVEFRRLLGVDQPVGLYSVDGHADARRRHRGRLVDLRDGDALDRLQGTAPFDGLAHTVEVPRVSSARRQGRYHIPGVGLFVWRLRPYPVTRGPAYCIDRARTHFTFSILGTDTPLVTRPVAEPSPHHIADDTNVPAFIRRRAFATRPADYYGPGKSLCVWLDETNCGEPQPVPLHRIVAADLSGWTYRPRRDQVAVDPVLGRIAFPSRAAPETGVWVSYHYAFSDDTGGGEYPRAGSACPAPPHVYRVGPGGGYDRIMSAVDAWQHDKAAHPDDPSYRDAAVELTDTGAYQEQIEIRLDRGDRFALRAAPGTRPVLRLLDWYSNRPDALRIVGTGEGSGPLPRITLDGLIVTGRSVRVLGPVGQVVVRHSTLVPGWSLGEHCEPEYDEEASLELSDTRACLRVERSIVGTIVVSADEVAAEPNAIHISDSIVDATSPELAALTAPDDRHAHAVLHVRRTTVFGAVRTHAIQLAADSIFHGDVRVARRQSGCVRFCWLPPGSRTPQRFSCQPRRGSPECGADADGPAGHDDLMRVVPRFTNTRYGTPGYAQLSHDCPHEISRGAEDGAEMGAFHDLFQPQREANLRLRLAEYTPAGCDAGIIFVT